MSFKIKQLTNGFAVLYNDKPVLIGKENKFAIPNTTVKIIAEETIPTKEVLKVAMCDKVNIPIEINKLGDKYLFTYSIDGIKSDSIKLFEKNLGDLSGQPTEFM